MKKTPKILVTDSKTIKEIQTEFDNKFPYLKIEFYKVAHSEKEYYLK